jgi:hypothetical protein
MAKARPKANADFGLTFPTGRALFLVRFMIPSSRRSTYWLSVPEAADAMQTPRIMNQNEGVTCPPASAQPRPAVKATINAMRGFVRDT